MATKRKVEASEDEPDAKRQDRSGWREYDGKPNLFIYEPKKPMHSESVYGFDLDGTIITTKSKKAFPTSRSDWVFFFPGIKDKLKSLIDEGYSL